MKTCAHCSEPATRFRNQTNFCTLRYRIKQMRDDAKVDKKKVPSTQALESLFADLAASGMRCSNCKRVMNWLRIQGHSTIVTLQHDRSGGVRLICLQCNVRHQHYEGDTFYDLPQGHKQCTVCRVIKPLAAFYDHKTYSIGKRSECKICSKAQAIAWIRRRRADLRMRTA